METTDSKENTVSIRISEAIQTQLLTEQARLKQETGVKPTFAELIATMWEKSGQSPSGDSLTPRTDAEREAVRKVLAHLRAGNELPPLEGELMAVPAFLRKTIAQLINEIHNEGDIKTFSQGMDLLARAFSLDAKPPSQSISIVKKNRRENSA